MNPWWMNENIGDISRLSLKFTKNSFVTWLANYALLSRKIEWRKYLIKFQLILSSLVDDLITQAKLVLYTMNFLFFHLKSQILLRQTNMFILKVFILINNQLLSTANTKDINTDYYITNSTEASRYHGSVA